MPRKRKETKYGDKISLREVSQYARIDRVTELLVKGTSRANIMKTIMSEWDISKSTANDIIDETLIYIADTTKATPEQIKSLNYNRLENIIGEADTVKDKCRVIDLENKMYGIYETNINVNSDNTFKFDIGVDGIN